MALWPCLGRHWRMRIMPCGACYAALAMQEAMRRYSAEVRRTHGVEVQIRVGLNSGEVVVRAIGNDLHMDYSAIGQTTHLAARMEQLAPPGSIRLTAETLRLAEGLMQVTALGPVPVKAAARSRWRCLSWSGLRPCVRRLQAASVRGLTPFVGRDSRTGGAVAQALARAGAGHGQVVALPGRAGVGKSRLVYEGHAVTPHPGLADPGEQLGVATARPRAYLPVLRPAQSHCGIEAHDDARRRARKGAGQGAEP